MNQPFFPSACRGRLAILYNGDEIAVAVRDLTAAGAQLSCRRAPPADAVVTFKGATGRRTALVRWSNEARMGIQFIEPLTPDDLRDELGQRLFDTAA